MDGINYPVHTDFRVALRIMTAFEDPELTDQERYIIMLRLLYSRRIPINTNQAVLEAVQFLNGGDPVSEEEEAPGPRVYSFSNDARFIFAAFRQTHGIDLEQAEMHWWKFLALFMDLGSDTAFCSLVALRRRVKSGKASREELEAARDMGAVFTVPETDMRSLQDRVREAEFMRAIQENARRQHANPV